MINKLEQLSRTIESFGKENLSDILHFMATGLKDLFGCKMVRVYLDDLYEGMLICHYATGQNLPHSPTVTQFISPRESIISRAFYSNEVISSWERPGEAMDEQNLYEKQFQIKSSLVIPVAYQFRPIGIFSLDWETEKPDLNSKQIEAICDFLSINSAIIERAKQFHQKISFSRHLDLARKKEAAWRMVRSAVNLIDKLHLASVLAPASVHSPQLQSSTPQDLIEVLSAFSSKKQDAAIYTTKDQMSIVNDENLINRIVKFDPVKGLVVRDAKQKSVYIHDIRQENFERKAIADQIHLVSLYQIPKFNKQTGQFICAVNYYTSTPYEFNDWEKRLLQEHASMVEKLILEESQAHIEIEVLTEIEELLSGQDNSLNSFLVKILDKTSELIGADCGTVSVLKMIENKPWLIVEDSQAKLVGSKSRGWKKSKIPPLPVGGTDLPPDQRSLTGYCAYSARPILVNNLRNSLLTQGFYKSLSPQIQSELAVPIISGNSVIGVINQDSFRKNYFTEEHKKILQIIARLISQKMFNLKHIEELRQEMTSLRQDIEYRDPNVSSYHFGNVIGKSRTIHALVRQVNTVVESLCNRMLRWEGGNQNETMMGLPSLLITGETGTGKEFFFNNIFSLITETFLKAKGPNYKLPLKKTNIAAYSGELTYSELFGHKKGAFTGAESNRQGILEEADGGVVFLDEIGDADPKTQVQLLRFLDTGVFLRLGENEPRYSRIFLIAATNKNLPDEIAAGRFREDLYHRLNALNFHLPTLNQRREDIEDLAIHFLGQLFRTYKSDLGEGQPQLLPDAADYLKNFNYSGNVRELKNILMRATLFAESFSISRKDILAATDSRKPGRTQSSQTEAPKPVSNGNNGSHLDLLEQLESGEGDFWSALHEPFRKKEITRDTIRSVLLTAKTRYQTNMPGLAVRLRACQPQFQNDPQENKKFIRFKNFLYKTVRITDS